MKSRIIEDSPRNSNEGDDSIRLNQTTAGILGLKVDRFPVSGAAVPQRGDQQEHRSGDGDGEFREAWGEAHFLTVVWGSKEYPLS